jgi:heptaprenyl diphosphate synthase
VKGAGMSAKKLAVLAVFTATALLMHFIESLLPGLSPVPGIKLGLANIVTVVLMAAMSRRDAGLVLLARILLGGIFSGRGVGLIYSAAGGAMSFAVCALLILWLSEKQLWALSVAGAVGHIIGQLAAAALVMGSFSVFAYAPLLTASAMAGGLFTGLCAQFLLAKIKKLGISFPS